LQLDFIGIEFRRYRFKVRVLQSVFTLDAQILQQTSDRLGHAEKDFLTSGVTALRKLPFKTFKPFDPSTSLRGAQDRRSVQAVPGIPTLRHRGDSFGLPLCRRLT
jgi:hypothetical protein